MAVHLHRHVSDHKGTSPRGEGEGPWCGQVEFWRVETTPIWQLLPKEGAKNAGKRRPIALNFGAGCSRLECPVYHLWRVGRGALDETFDRKLLNAFEAEQASAAGNRKLKSRSSSLKL
eukprot:1686157-Amphidinium_carterae.2